jgi:hypothetical protein
MSNEVSRTYEFNTAITALPESGVFDEKAHQAQIDPVFRRIKQKDGITKCFIGPYGTTVHYMPNVIDEADIFATVQEAVTWAAGQEGLFPLRGDKTPQASREVSTPAPPQHRQKVSVFFGTDLVAYPAKPNGDFDQARFDELTSGLVQQLADVDGVRHIKITQGAAAVVFDTRRNDAHTIQERMTDVFLGAEANDAMMFPHADNTAELELSFTVGQPY